MAQKVFLVSRVSHYMVSAPNKDLAVEAALKGRGDKWGNDTLYAVDMDEETLEAQRYCDHFDGRHGHRVCGECGEEVRE